MRLTQELSLLHRDVKSTDGVAQKLLFKNRLLTLFFACFSLPNIAAMQCLCNVCALKNTLPGDEVFETLFVEPVGHPP